MKIVFLAPFGIRPKGTVIARMIPIAVELQVLGHEVVIVAPPYTNPEDSGKTEMVRGVRLRNIVLGPRHKVLAAPILAWRMFSAAVAEKPDLIHLFKPKGYGGIAAMMEIVLKQLGIRLPPLVLDTDDWEGEGGMNELHGYSGPEKRFYQFQEQWITRRVPAVTVASKGLEELVAGMQIDPSRILYLPNGVEAVPPGDGRGVRARLGIPAGAPVLLLYTRFFEFKQQRLHAVFAAVHAELPEVVFLVVGKGRHGEEEQLLAAARASGFEKSLVFGGWVEPVELPDFLAAGDVALYPFEDNLVNRTKCPAKLTELFRAGIPAIGDRVGQIPEYTPPQMQHLLCDPANPQEMANRAVQLLIDPSARLQLGEACRRHVLQNFAWSAIVAELDRLYDQLSNEWR